MVGKYGWVQGSSGGAVRKGIDKEKRMSGRGLDIKKME